MKRDDDKFECRTNKFASLVYIGVLIITSILPFLASINGPFIFDDHVAIRKNKDVYDLNTSLWDTFSHDFWGMNITEVYSHKSYRPVTTLSFRLNTWLHGIKYVTGYHCVNLLLNAVATILGYILICETSKVICFGETSRISNHEIILSCIMFSVHAVHSENVCGIVGRADIMCFIFSTISLTGFIKGLVQISVVVVSPYDIIRWISFVCISEIAYFFAVLAKELGVTIVILKVIVFLVYEINMRQLRQSDIRLANITKISTSAALRIISVTLAASTAVSVTVFRMYTNNWELYKFSMQDNPFNYIEPIHLRVINMIYLWTIHMFLLISPVWLCFDWSMNCIPKISSMMDVRVCFVVMFITLTIMISASITRSLMAIHRHNLMVSQKRNIFVWKCYWLLWILVTFLPSSGILFEVGFVVAERILYLPSLGFAVLSIHAMNTILRFKNTLKTFILLGTLSALATKSYLRSSDWAVESVLYKSGIKVCPNNGKVYYNIGKVSSENGNIDEAILAYKIAIRLQENYEQALNNLGNLERQRGNLNRSEELLHESIRASPTFASAYMNLGITQLELKKYNESERAFRRALQLRKQYPLCHHNLAHLHFIQNQFAEALLEWERAVEEDPNLRQAWEGMINCYSALGNLNMAEATTKKSLQIFPGAVPILKAIAKAYGRSESQKALKEGIKILETVRKTVQHVDPDLLHDLAVFYHKVGFLTDAFNTYKEAQHILESKQYEHPEWNSLRERLQYNLDGLKNTRKTSKQSEGDSERF